MSKKYCNQQCYYPQRSQITEENWVEFSKILSVTAVSQFKDKLYFLATEIDLIQFILDETCGLTNIDDETFFEIPESKVISQAAIKVEDLSQCSYEQIKHIGSCSRFFSTYLNTTVFNTLNDVPINILIMENLIKWLIKTMTSFTGFDDTIFASRLCNNLLSLVSACVQREDYLYRKITNSPNFNKVQMIKLLEKMIIITIHIFQQEVVLLYYLQHWI